MNSLSFKIHITCPMLHSNDALQARFVKILLILLLVVPLLGVLVWIGQTCVQDNITIMEVHKTHCGFIKHSLILKTYPMHIIIIFFFLTF